MEYSDAANMNFRNNTAHVVSHKSSPSIIISKGNGPFTGLQRQNWSWGIANTWERSDSFNKVKVTRVPDMDNPNWASSMDSSAYSAYLKLQIPFFSMNQQW
eukprot:12713935-Ditylum_brightwellii.AAC.1